MSECQGLAQEIRQGGQADIGWHGTWCMAFKPKALHQGNSRFLQASHKASRHVTRTINTNADRYDEQLQTLANDMSGRRVIQSLSVCVMHNLRGTFQKELDFLCFENDLAE